MMRTTLHPQACLASFTKTRSVWSHPLRAVHVLCEDLVIWLQPVRLRTGFTNPNAVVGSCSNRRSQKEQEEL